MLTLKVLAQLSKQGNVLYLYIFYDRRNNFENQIFRPLLLTFPTGARPFYLGELESS